MSLSELQIFQARIDDIKQAASRGRAVFLAVTIVAGTALACCFTTYFSWVRAFADPKFKDSFITTGNTNTSTYYLQTQLLKDWVDATFVSVPGLGAKLSVNDASSWASIGLLASALWLFFCLRRENHLIAYVLLDAEKYGDPAIYRLVVHSIRASQVFATGTALNTPFNTTKEAEKAAEKAKKVAENAKNTAAEAVKAAAEAVKAAKKSEEAMKTAKEAKKAAKKARKTPKEPEEAKKAAKKSEEAKEAAKKSEEAKKTAKEAKKAAKKFKKASIDAKKNVTRESIPAWMMRAQMYLPAVALLCVLICDILSVLWLAALFRGKDAPIGLDAVRHDLKFKLMMGFGFVCFVGCAVLGKSAALNQSATRNLVRGTVEKLHDPGYELPTYKARETQESSREAVAALAKSLAEIIKSGRETLGSPAPTAATQQSSDNTPQPPLP